MNTLQTKGFDMFKWLERHPKTAGFMILVIFTFCEAFVEGLAYWLL